MPLPKYTFLSTLSSFSVFLPRFLLFSIPSCVPFYLHPIFLPFAVSHIPSPCSIFIKLLPFFLTFSLPHSIFSLSPSATFSFFLGFLPFFLSSLFHSFWLLFHPVHNYSCLLILLSLFQSLLIFFLSLFV
jgi:hypothetical protein